MDGKGGYGRVGPTAATAGSWERFCAAGCGGGRGGVGLRSKWRRNSPALADGGDGLVELSPPPPIMTGVRSGASRDAF